MNVLLLGSGGREHALAWKMAQSKKLNKLFIAPGNAGTVECGTNVNINTNDFYAIKKFVIENYINMVVVGPEEPLVKGIHDFFLSDALLKEVIVIGPQKDGAQLEGSKDFSKRFMKKYNIPTAAYQSFTSVEAEEGRKFLRKLPPPYVLKADGLAGGKGVVICNTIEEAEKELEDMLIKSKFGAAGSKVVIEEFLHGVELSVFILADGENYLILPEAKDYKRIGEEDSGPNTGGMGAVSPVPFAGKEFIKKVEEKIIIPTMRGLKTEGISYKGFIFFGLMNCNGNPYVIEYNCRMGDPETEVVIPRIKNDLLDLFEAVGQGKLNTKVLEVDNSVAATVVLVSEGYPGEFPIGRVVSGLENIIKDNTIVFHAGTKLENGKILTNGGRVLAVTACSKDMSSALEQTYSNIKNIFYEGLYFRRDIGSDLLQLQPDK